MEPNKINVRYGHSEGHTALSYENTGRYFFTCGADGEVRIWDGLQDDDPVTIRVGEVAYAIAINKDKFYVSSDANMVLSYTFPKGTPDGIVSRFSAPVNSICLSDDCQKMLVGASDFTIKYVNVPDFSFKVLLGHEAPILSLALDPKLEFAASSSCDGTVRIWKLDNQTCVKSWPSILPATNDFSASSVLCRLAWQPNSGKFLAVPKEKVVKMISRNTWNEAFVLSDEAIAEPINVVSFTKNEQFLAAACLKGSIFVWNLKTRKCIHKLKHPKGITICSLEWNPNGSGEIIFCDIQGYLGGFQNILETESAQNLSNNNNVEVDAKHSEFRMDFDDDDHDENSFSISKIKAETLGLEGAEDSQDSLMNDLKGIATKDGGKDNGADKARAEIVNTSLITSLQKPFQPGSTPLHYSQRFMVWNSVGIVRSYNTDEENSIDIEFHDTSIHHTMHLENILGHTLACISNKAILLACAAQSEIPSKLVCMHFSSWDSCKEWTVDMPEAENVEAIAISDEWIAAATDQRLLRIFNIGSVQRQMIVVPGPVVSLAAHTDYIILAYHKAMGVPGDQCLGLMLVTIMNGKVAVSNHSLPLTSKATLAWLGFTDEGTPCCSDSQGVVRILPHKSFGDGWLQIANTKEYCKGKSDHYFIVGLSETQQNIRCIPCKATRYPATLPHPTVTVLPFRLPLCDVKSEKGQLEETYWKNSLLIDTFANLQDLGYEPDFMVSERTKALQKESLMKLFALATRNDRDFRAMELAKMMDSYHTVQLAIKYATQLKHLTLAQRLGEVAYEKLQQETEAHTLQEETSYSTSANLKQNTRTAQESRSRSIGREPDQDEVDEDEIIPESQETPVRTPRSSGVLSSAERYNPFKISINRKETRGIQVLDTLKTTELPQKKEPAGKTISAKAIATKTPVSSSKPKVQRQTQLFKSKKNTDSSSESENKEQHSPHPVAKSGYQLWLEANREQIKLDNPEMDESRVALLAVQTFKKLSPEEKEKWNDKGKQQKPVETQKTPVLKRKHEESEPAEQSESGKKIDNEERSDKAKKTTNSFNKLARFACDK